MPNELRSIETYFCDILLCYKRKMVPLLTIKSCVLCCACTRYLLIPGRPLADLGAKGPCSPALKNIYSEWLVFACNQHIFGKNFSLVLLSIILFIPTFKWVPRKVVYWTQHYLQQVYNHHYTSVEVVLLFFNAVWLIWPGHSHQHRIKKIWCSYYNTLAHKNFQASLHSA